ncbi:hypothetical protein AAFF_G00270070 [Aldrovandia affinis]|uniref:Uncharacterized protein n=1 Tax=Aldrovandia affinis TaxID=143900 RepID=A0AAD7SSN8_9TELE|nr:hypothetical protein AAFF_G00270070 [Aldrovandia affinis]
MLFLHLRPVAAFPRACERLKADAFLFTQKVGVFRRVVLPPSREGVMCPTRGISTDILSAGPGAERAKAGRLSDCPRGQCGEKQGQFGRAAAGDLFLDEGKPCSGSQQKTSQSGMVNAQQRIQQLGKIC